MSDNDQQPQQPQQPWPGQAYGDPGQQYQPQQPQPAPPSQPGPPAQQAPAPAPNLNVGAPSDMGRLIANAPPAPVRGYASYTLPASVKNSEHWSGTDSDLVFGLWEPNAGEIRKMTKSDVEWSDAAKNFVAMVGGVPVTDNTSQVLPWWSRISPKAQTLVTSLFVESIMPTEAEGESLRASRKWVGG